MKNVVAVLHEPVSAYSVAWFRIVLGAAFCFETFKLWRDGHIQSQFVDPNFYFKYPGFHWIIALPGPIIYLLFTVVFFSGLLVMFGVAYRAATITLFLSWSYLFLVDQCNYMNHYYLMVLLAMLLIVIPADRVMSFSDSFKREQGLDQKSDLIPRWCLLLLQFQLAVPYFFGAIYKMHSDWLGRGEPMQEWLKTSVDLPLIGKWMGTEFAAYSFSWGGMLFDLLIVPAIIFRPTRIIAIVVYLSFHLINTQMHNIGVFPWLMIGALPIFLAPDLMKKVWKPNVEKRESYQPRPHLHWAIWIFVAFQLAIPLRHWAYHDWVLWNDRGSFFAWNMRPKRVLSGKQFLVVDHQQEAQWGLKVDEILTPFQQQRFNRPEMYRQLALNYKRFYQSKRNRDVEIYLAAFRGLNGRKPIRLIDQKRDLTKTGFWDSSWILPFRESEYPFPQENAALVGPDSGR